MKISLLILVFCLSTAVFGQSSNPFTERSYWKNQPSMEQVKSDIEQGNDPSEFNEHKFDAVTWAIIEQVPDELVLFLIDQNGNDVNKRSHDGRTPIFWAAYRGNLRLMKTLIQKGAKTDLIDSHGYSLVNFAASTGQLDISLYNLCIENGADFQKEFNKDNATPLLLIMPHLESTDMISYFTSKGLSLNHLDANGNNAFVYAAKSGNQVVMNFLLDNGISATINESAAVLSASKGMRGKKNGVETFQYLQKVGLSLDAEDEQGRNALYFLASTCKDPSVFNFFLDEGLSLNHVDKNKDIPLFKAFENNSPDMISFLLSKQGIKEGITNEKGENVIHLAVSRGNAEVLQLALETEASINLMSEVGLTPLHMAAMQAKDLDVIELLLKAGADKKVETPFEETAFDLANENKWLTDKKRVRELLN